MKNADAKNLLKRYRANECTDEEKSFVEYHLIHGDLDFPSLTEDELYASKQIAIAHNKKFSLTNLQKYGVAASFILVISIAALLFTRKTIVKDDLSSIKPGKNQATLILPNGKEIKLNDVKNGELAVDQGVRIIKQADGQLLYLFNSPSATGTARRDSMPASVAVNEVPSNPLNGLNKLTTPRGGQYHIALPDGTNVWVNAGSTLCFPSSFEDLPERRVLLIGEAYFEVAQVKTLFGMKKRARKVPFIVKTASQEVMVLGTHFNINAYPDEKETKTTLLEGSVGITAPLLQAEQTILKPNDQAINDGSEIKVKRVNIDEAVAWKNGYFQFDDVDIRAVMRQFSRWYNIDVVYEGNIPKGSFRGQLPRRMTLQKALDVLSFSEINYKLQGKKLIIKTE